MYPEAEKIQTLVNDAKQILIIQADNPDGDSLGSALALEHILGDMGKEPYLFCSVSMPTYLRYVPGWDRVNSELPDKFDLSIIVDTSAMSLLENIAPFQSHLSSHPCIVIDHHDVETNIPFATVVCNKTAVATGEVIYELAKQLNWKINLEGCQALAVAIMSDSLGLSTEATTARTVHIVAELMESGVSLSALEQSRKQLMFKSPELVHFKGELLQRIEYSADDRIATITIPWSEIERYSSDYNPSVLVLEDMRMTTGVRVAIAFKVYKDGKVTAKIRCNNGSPIAGTLAEHFGGGGHAYSSGFKIQGGRAFTEIKKECIAEALELLNKS